MRLVAAERELACQQQAGAASVNWAAFDNRFAAGAVVFVEKDFAGGAADQFGENATPPAR